MNNGDRLFSRIGIGLCYASLLVITIPVILFFVKENTPTSAEQLYTICVLMILLLCDLAQKRTSVLLGDAFAGVMALPLIAVTGWRIWLFTSGKTPGQWTNCFTVIIVLMSITTMYYIGAERWFIMTSLKAQKPARELSEDRAFAVAANAMRPSADRIRAVNMVYSLSKLEALEAECAVASVKQAIRLQIRSQERLMRLMQTPQQPEDGTGSVRPRPFSPDKPFYGNTCKPLWDRTGETVGTLRKPKRPADRKKLTKRLLPPTDD